MLKRIVEFSNANLKKNVDGILAKMPVDENIE